tara:strand:- start:6 stop:284 length:279 start_codon:yes stop_codon:yes gene_type:complete
MATSKNIETKLLFIERKKLYNLPEKDRVEVKLGDIELIDFGISCSKYSMKSDDWRFLNLALKILDSKSVSANKLILKKEIEISLNSLKENIL